MKNETRKFMTFRNAIFVLNLYAQVFNQKKCKIKNKYKETIFISSKQTQSHAGLSNEQGEVESSQLNNSI